MIDERLNKLAKLLVNYSTGVKKGDFVFIQCDEVAEPWLAAVTKEAILAGGHVETMLTSQQVGEIRLKYSTKEQLHEENFIMRNTLEKADVWLTAWANRNTKTNSRVEPSKMMESSVGATSWRKVYSERMGDGTLRWSVLNFQLIQTLRRLL